MADPLSIAASIIAVLQVSQTVVNYLDHVRGASDDRHRILLEISHVNGLLFSLKDLVERSPWEDAWATTVASLDVPNGPLAQFKSALEHLGAKLAPVTGMKKARNTLSWPFQKGEVVDLLRTIERQKSLFCLVLTKDHM